MTWKGKDPSLRPVVLMSHQDVVPAPNDEDWTHPPFGGTVSQGWIWGRGTLDTKGTLIGILEAVEQMLREGFEPTRTVILSFGHDEELGGAFGAQAIVEKLHSRGVDPELVLDEGGMIFMDGLQMSSMTIVPGPLAVVGTAEKGIQNWRIDVSGVGGHASMPPTGHGTSVAARISRILARLEADLTSTRLDSPTTDFLMGIRRSTRLSALRLLLRLSGHRFFNAALGQVLGLGGPELAAMVRSTVGIVGIQAGGEAHNVLPTRGSILLNIRTLPGDDVKTVEQYIKYSIQKEEEGTANISLVDRVYDPSPITPAQGRSWDFLVQAIQETTRRSDDEDQHHTKAHRCSVVPFMLVGRTDSNWFSKIAPNRVFRFSPIRLSRSAGDLAGIHGIDERIRIEDWFDVIRFFLRFIRLMAGDSGD